MKLTVVGCSGSFPGPDSTASCYLVEHDGCAILLDLGNGSLGSLARFIDIYSVAAVVCSHLHIDHCADLCSYYVALRYRPDHVAQRVPVWGPPGIAGRMAAMYDLPEQPGMKAEFDFQELGSGPIQIGPFVITSTLVRHAVDNYALRVEAGDRTLVYSGDTGPCPELITAAAGADIALFEASFLEGNDNPCCMHLTGAEAARAAAAANVGRLVLTHLVPWNDSRRVLAEAVAAWPGETVLARTGMTLEV